MSHVKPGNLKPTRLVASSTMSKLAGEGRILIEISGQNWRTVTILEGPHKGKTTMKNPDPKAYVWQTIGRVQTIRGNPKQPKRMGPSAPRLIKAVGM